MSAGKAADFFRATFGRAPGAVASAPGRVNLIGEHTDYNGGEVLPIAIARRTWVAMGPGSGPRVRAVSAARKGQGAFRVSDAAPAGRWWDYVHGTLRELAAEGVPVDVVDVAVVSDVPSGAGLSSSAALEVATAWAAMACAGRPPAQGRDRIATVAHRAETNFVGVSCGIMDQTASACGERGHALRLWCDTGRREQVPFERTVLVVDTASPRALRTSAFNQRQASCARALAALRGRHPHLTALAHATLDALADVPLAEEDRRRARHVIAESARVGAFVAALRAGGALGGLLAASHESLRTDYECSSPELDWVVEFASCSPGVEGARMTGAGWGGCAIAVGSEHGLEALAANIVPAFEIRWGRRCRPWLTRAEAGGRLDLGPS